MHLWSPQRRPSPGWPKISFAHVNPSSPDSFSEEVKTAGGSTLSRNAFKFEIGDRSLAHEHSAAKAKAKTATLFFSFHVFMFAIFPRVEMRTANKAICVRMQGMHPARTLETTTTAAENLFYLFSAQSRVINVVGTRHAQTWAQLLSMTKREKTRARFRK
jgi:hypothetical protein